tara:strand:+ start:2434 stop:2844 length:411 start_codon:yes stop_codon:yes gene_type:complete
MLNSIEKYQEELKAAYDFDQEPGQFQYLIELGKKKDGLGDSEKNDTNKMFGCLAQVWIVCAEKEGKFHFLGDSDAHIVKGLVSIIADIMSGLTVNEIAKIRHNIVDRLGLGPGLTARRQVGMMAMIDHIKNISGAK